MVMLYLRLMRTRWVRTALGVLVLSVLLWFFGPLIGLGQAHPFDSALVRIIVIGLMVVLWLCLNLYQDLHAARREKALVAEVSAQDAAAAADAEAVAAETKLLSDGMRTALLDLRKAKLGGRSGRKLYQLPWYMFIGPPGAGKTTALVKCGLRFPLADAAGPRAVAGVGGTRNCDWWFTDDAVLIDTAGRYTTQDSQANVDAAAWTGFLRLLKKHRGRQPLNGVLLAISLSDLSELDEAARTAHAQTMRRRLRELHDELGVRLPVYVLFTKADLIAGFVEFFDPLTREAREQVWGTTFALDSGTASGSAVDGFAAGFDALLARLGDQLLERLDQETDPGRRRLIYGFPQQVASLRDVARDFLTEIFRPSRLEARALLRGVYLTSGTQDGTPIDRLLGAMAGQFGLPRQAVTAMSGAGRSYFLARLIREVIFAEAGLVSTDPRLERRATWTGRAAYGLAAAFVLFLGGFWTLSYVGNVRLMADAHEAAGRYAAEFKTLADRGPQDTDLQAVLPPLDTLRGLRGGYAERDRSVPIALTFGLYQGEKLGTAATDAYFHALDNLLLPRLLARLEAGLTAHLGQPDALYELLKVYLILGRQGPLDAGLVSQWLAAELAAEFPGDDGALVRGALMDHAAAMLERDLPAIPLDGGLIARAREVLTREPLAEYSYGRILRSRRMRELPEWTVQDNAGPGGARVFMLRSGKKLDTGVPGAFTYTGYHVLLTVLPTVTQDIAEDGWVLGKPKRGVQATLSETTHLRRDVLGLYLDDYVRRWDGLLGDVAVRPFGNMQQGLDELNLLQAPDSPLRDLLQALDTQTQLSHAGAADKATAKAEGALGRMGSKAAGFAKLEGRMGLSREENEIASILGEGFDGGGTGAKPVDPATRVDAHFRWIHEFVTGADGQPPAMEAAITKMGAMYQNFSQVSSSANPGMALLKVVGGGGGGGGGGSPAAQLAALATGLPKPVAAMLKTVSTSGAGVTSSGASQQLSDAWRSKVLPLCTAAFNRYPFVAGSAADVPVDDFARLLAPGGLMDGFFNDNLASLVDTSQEPWRWQSADHLALGLSPNTLTQFQRAAQIRDALFSGGPQISVKFELVPVSLDARVQRVSLDIAGQTMRYDNGPIESASFQWPSGGRTMVRVTMTPAGGGHETIIEKDGPWALLHLMDAARVVPSGQPDRFRLIFTSPAGQATFELNASSVHNPFTMGALRSFRCPARL